MAEEKWCHDDVLDQSLNYIKNNATRICVCSAKPTTYAEAITTYMLAIKTIGPTDFTGPADGDESGRKLTSNLHAGITVAGQGDPTHIALVDSINSKLLYVTQEASSQIVYVGNTCNVPAWNITIADPV
jgi:hypothetical protein